MAFLERLKETYDKGEIPEKIEKILLELYESYSASLAKDGLSMEAHDEVFDALLKLVQEELASPYTFEPIHRKITEPYNYFRFGVEFVRPLVDKTRSEVLHMENVEKMERQIAAGENVILFANHQTEVDPQLLNLALEENHPKLASEIFFVAGDRVITDPMAIPFSKGCNLLCIYSKRHIDNPPEKKEEKLQHNQRTMKRMRQLLTEGGHCIYMAPSGGRDRPNREGEVLIAPFDPQSIEMFRLMAKQAKTPAHFYPLALATFDILPPPQSVESELGEKRTAQRDGARFAFGDEIDMLNFPGSDVPDRHAQRIARGMYIQNLVKSDYNLLKKRSS